MRSTKEMIKKLGAKKETLSAERDLITSQNFIPPFLDSTENSKEDLLKAILFMKLIDPHFKEETHVNLLKKSKSSKEKIRNPSNRDWRGEHKEARKESIQRIQLAYKNFFEEAKDYTEQVNDERLMNEFIKNLNSAANTVNNSIGKTSHKQFKAAETALTENKSQGFVDNWIEEKNIDTSNIIKLREKINNQKKKAEIETEDKKTALSKVWEEIKTQTASQLKETTEKLAALKQAFWKEELENMTDENIPVIQVLKEEFMSLPFDKINSDSVVNYFNDPAGKEEAKKIRGKVLVIKSDLPTEIIFKTPVKPESNSREDFFKNLGENDREKDQIDEFISTLKTDFKQFQIAIHAENQDFLNPKLSKEYPEEKTSEMQILTDKFKELKSMNNALNKMDITKMDVDQLDQTISAYKKKIGEVEKIDQTSGKDEVYTYKP